MSFLQPFILFGLPLALLPLIIHLLNRLRYRSVSWGAIMFVLKASRNSTSMARIRQWLILLLRIFAVAALVAALARPLLGGWLGWRLSGSPSTVIILLDRSATMGKIFSGDQDLLTRGMNVLAETGAKSAPDSRIILIDSFDMRIKQIPSWDVLNKIDETKITQAGADIPAMFRIALNYILKSGSGVTEIWTLSDMQRSNWMPESMVWGELNSEFKALLSPVTIKALAVSSKKTGNRSITFKKVVEYRSDSGESVYELVFDLYSDTGHGGELPLGIVNNGSKQQFNVKISSECTKIRHNLPASPKGKILYGSVTLPPDSNLQDNQLFFAYGEKLHGNILIYSENSLLAEILSAAAVPVPNNDKVEIINKKSSFKSKSLENVSTLIWNGYFSESDKWDKILNYMKKGGVVLFFPPLHQKAAAENIAENNLTVPHWNTIVSFPADKPMEIVGWDHSSGVFADSVSGTPLPLDSLKLYKRCNFACSSVDSSALCTDGHPLLYRKSYGENGKLYACSTLPLPEWSNFGEGMVLVPMFSRMINEGKRRFSKIIFADCGKWRPVSSSTPPETLVASDISNSSSVIDGGVFGYERKLFVLNRPEVEDIKGVITGDELKKRLKDNRIFMFNESAGTDSNLQTEVWRWFLIAMFIFLMVESYFLIPDKEEI